MTDTDDKYAELDAALTPLRTTHPGLTNAEVAELLPQHLRQPLWERAIGRYLDEKLAELAAQPQPKPVETVTTTGLL